VNRADVATSLFWLAVGAFIVWSGWDLELGSASDPGSGFLLFWTGLVMVVLSAVVLVGALRGQGTTRWVGGRWGKIVLVVAALALYGWLLEWLGFVLTTALLLLFLFKVVEPQRWWVAAAGALGSAVLGYVVFKVWLGAQLPAGVFGIG
jgi:putative tricarboxylic transport membrane protein